jgi:hypothetical protein
MARTVKTSAKPGAYRKGGGIVVVKPPKQEPREHTVRTGTSAGGKRLAVLTPVPEKKAAKPAAKKKGGA